MLILDEDLTLQARDGAGTVTLHPLGAAPCGGQDAVVTVFPTRTVELRDLWVVGNSGWRALDVAGIATVVGMRTSALANTCVRDGGSFSVTGELVLIDSVFAEPSSADLGGIGLVTGRLEVLGGTLANGSATDGGALRATGTAAVTLTGVTLTGNQASDDGGAVDADAGATLAVVGCAFSDNVAADEGGAIYANGIPSLAVSDSSFLRNLAGGGGAISIEGTDGVSLRDSEFTTNESTMSDGGAVRFQTSSDAVVRGNRFEDNQSDIDGGAVVLDGGTGHLVAGNLFCHNWAQDDGGGMDVDGADASVRNNLFVENTAAQEGGGVELRGGAVSLMFNHLIANGAVDGSAVNLEGGTHTIQANLLAQHVGVALTELTAATVTEQGNAWSGNEQDAAFALTSPVTGNPRLRGVVPGACPGDYRPGPGSALRDAASGLDVDGSTSDIGGYGGPDGNALDIDRDGVPGRVDCDDFDATVGECAKATGDTGGVGDTGDTGAVADTGGAKDTGDTGLAAEDTAGNPQDTGPSGGAPAADLPPLFYCGCVAAPVSGAWLAPWLLVFLYRVRT